MKSPSMAVLSSPWIINYSPLLQIRIDYHSVLYEVAIGRLIFWYLLIDFYF
jgi:hypothetical protein